MNPSGRLPAELPLHKLRQARGLSQQGLADRMNVKQPIVAKQEHQGNMHISTLRCHIEAMGGKLEIVARFPEGDVRISNF
jgi:predicted transcriptional regulator